MLSFLERPRLILLSIAIQTLGSACSSDSTPGSGDGGTDAGPDVGGETMGTGLALTGTVKDKAGVAVSRAKLEVGTASVFSDPQGQYTLAVPVGGRGHAEGDPPVVHTAGDQRERGGQRRDQP